MNIIACVNNDWSIGYKGDLLYKIPEDMKFFKSKTINRAVIMGNSTFQSLDCRPLPNRKNIVLSSSLSYSNDVIVCRSVEEVYIAIEDIPTNDIYIIGGESIYRTFLDDCFTAYITKIYDSCPADTTFPLNLDASKKWSLFKTSETFEYTSLRYNFNVYVRNIS